MVKADEAMPQEKEEENQKCEMSSIYVWKFSHL